MPPKKQTESLTLEDLNKNITDKFHQLSSKLDEALMSNAAIEKCVVCSEREILHLQQRERSHNLRVLGLKLPITDSPKVFSTAEAVFNVLVEPILKLACEEGELPEVPSLIQTFDACHSLPCKKDEVPAIHIRFQSKLIRELIFHYKGKFFKTAKLQCSVYEDLCPSLRLLLQRTKEREDVERAWSRNGRIKFRIKNNNEIHTAKM